jgi:flagellar biosynthesis/type III secretory pathway chaperone
MNLPGDFQRLHQLLQAEGEAARQLAACLEQEQQALTELDAATLETVVGTKTQLLQQMEQHATERLRLASAAGYDHASMAAFLAAVDPQDQLGADWQALLAALETCQHRNRVNGGIIELGRQRLHMTLALLRGQPSGPRANLYQANGRSPAQLDHRALGTA